MVSMKKLSFDKDEFKNQLRSRLVYLRGQSNYTLEEIAEKVGLTYQQVHNHEIGTSNVYPHHLINYARVYDKPVSFFFGDENNEAISDLAKDKRNLVIAAEVAQLQDDIKITLFNLAKQVNKSLKNSESKEHGA